MLWHVVTDIHEIENIDLTKYEKIYPMLHPESSSSQQAGIEEDASQEQESSDQDQPAEQQEQGDEHETLDQQKASDQEDSEDGEPKDYDGMSTSDMLQTDDYKALKRVRDIRQNDLCSVIIRYSGKEGYCGHKGLEKVPASGQCNRGCVITLYPAAFRGPTSLSDVDPEKVRREYKEERLFPWSGSLSATLIHELAHLAVYNGTFVPLLLSAVLAALVLVGDLLMLMFE
jgi:hypothetical protein